MQRDKEIEKLENKTCKVKFWMQKVGWLRYCRGFSR